MVRMTKKLWFNHLLARLQQDCHRELLVIQGDDVFRQDWLDLIFTNYSSFNQNFSSIEVVEQPFPSQFTQCVNQQLAHQLGQEKDLAIFHSSQGISPNQLAQASGMIKAGGLCILCLENDWQNKINPAMASYLSYPHQLKDGRNGFRLFLKDKLQQFAIQLIQNQPLPQLTAPLSSKQKISLNKPLEPTQVQRAGIKAIESVAFGHRHRPLLINADRGRGKSSMLGFAAIELFQSGKTRIAITAANPMQTKQITAKAIEFATNSQNKVVFDKKVPRGVAFKALNSDLKTKKDCFIAFYSPDELIANKQDFDILFVDEAAHLPLPILKQLTDIYSRIVFASTDSGYEGSGMGFRLKFAELLSDLNYKKITLNQPLRWNNNDPLEHAINQSLLLSNQLTKINNTKIAELEYKQIDTQSLTADTQLTEQIFQLLVQAHYQTTPNNLMQLLEDPTLILWLALNKNQQPIAVLLAFKEGGIEQKKGQRFRGHLVPQLLAKQTHDSSWLNRKSYRINRIAVQPNFQRQGIATKLFQSFSKETCQNNLVDYLSVSFAATEALILFWAKQNFIPLYLGIKRDKASATHSLSMLKGFNKATQQAVINTHDCYATQFAYLLQSSFQQLETAVVLQLLTLFNYSSIDFPEGYLKGQPFEAVSEQLQQWSLRHAGSIKSLPTPLQAAWVKKNLQNLPWKTTLNNTPFSSRKQLETAFKNTILSPP